MWRTPPSGPVFRTRCEETAPWTCTRWPVPAVLTVAAVLGEAYSPGNLRVAQAGGLPSP